MNSADEVSLSFRRLSVRDQEIYCYVNRFSPQFEKDNMCLMSKKKDTSMGIFRFRNVQSMTYHDHT